MAISINWSTYVIAVPQADLTPLGGSQYELDVDWFRLQLKDIEDSEEGMVQPDTHRHNTEVVLSGVTYSRFVEILSPYTITFQDTGSPYTIKCVGANHNIADRKNVNNVSLIIGNSAGLITVASGSGLDAGQDAKLTGIYAQLTAIEESLDHNEMMRLFASVLLSKVSGAGTGLEKFRDLADTKDRVTVTVDTEGNRTAVVRDAS